ncbi:LacI family DNA-binding transcriptional regulator [Litorilinea aerophila]|uniref:LacI family transcriptional regulator n=1 Tax=Litorilinea aerophila TaxID=1204385 RepID=A0A540VEF9_9CHLR|nr:LacI family DNA-binding transcriptional regulator [Litorilinea aerophila]MCC9077731.1 LacI family DNA-binding transcriptional regulator [Litorilinea aerophila]
MKRVTLKDVAREAGVSYQTVSKVLNGKGSVTEATAARIWAAVNRLGYRPYVTARNLRKRASFLIGYSWKPMPPDQVNPILDKFLTSTVEAAEEAGYHLLLFPLRREDQEAVAQYRELIVTGRVDGFILSSTNYDDPRIRLLLDSRFPFVAFGRTNPDWDFPYVDVDGRAGTCMATRHLLEQGHRRIALLAWPDHSRAGTARFNGYLQAMAEAGIPICDEWIRRGEGHFNTGYQHTRELLALPADRRPTAVVAVDDQQAIGAMRAAQEAGLAVGPDFGVTGFDDTPGVQLLSPPLTSVRQPIWEVGQRIVQLLVAILRGEEPAERHILLQPELIVRQSSLRHGTWS